MMFRFFALATVVVFLSAPAASAENRMRIFAGGEGLIPIQKYDFGKAGSPVGSTEGKIGFGLGIHHVAPKGYQTRTVLQYLRTQDAGLVQIGFGFDLLFGGSFFFGPGVTFAYGEAFATQGAFSEREGGWMWTPRFVVGYQISHNHRLYVAGERGFAFKNGGLLDAFENFHAVIGWVQRY